MFRVGPPLSLSRRAAGAELDGRRGHRRAALRPRRSAPASRASTTSGCATPGPCRPTVATCSRMPSRPCGTAATRVDGFNALVLAAGLTWRQATLLRAYAKYMRQGGTPFAQDYIEGALKQNVDITRLAGRSCSRRASTPAAADDMAADAESRAARTEELRRADHQVARRRREPRPRPDPALVPHGHRGDAAHQLLPGRRRRRAKPYISFKLAARQRSPTCPSRGPGSRSSCTRPGSRACICASARSPAAACAGRTAATTSAPRCSAWSRRRWSRTP